MKNIKDFYLCGYFIILSIFIPATYSSSFIINKPFRITYWFFGLIYISSDESRWFFLPDLIGIVLTCVMIFCGLEITMTSRKIREGTIELYDGAKKTLILGVLDFIIVIVWIYTHPFARILAKFLAYAMFNENFYFIGQELYISLIVGCYVALFVASITIILAIISMIISKINDKGK